MVDPFANGDMPNQMSPTLGTREIEPTIRSFQPGRKAGQFTNPVDVTLIPEKEVDGFATLRPMEECSFDSEGRTLISWTASPSYDPEGGLVVPRTSPIYLNEITSAPSYKMKASASIATLKN